MNILPFFQKEERSSSPENPATPLSNPAQWLVQLFGGGPSHAGVNVNTANALEVAAVWQAVNVISSTIASLPLQVFKRDGEGREPAIDHSAYYVLHEFPNDEQTSYGWRKMMMQQLLLPGRHQSRIVLDQRQEVRDIIPLDATTATVFREGGRKRYRYRLSNGRTETYDSSEILDLAFSFADDGLSHFSPISKMRNAIGLTKALEAYGSRFFANDARPGLWIEAPHRLSPAASERMRQDVEAKTKSAENKHSAAALPPGYKIHTVGIQPDHAQFLETRKHQIHEIACIYNIPVTFLMEDSKANFSNSEQQDLNFAKHTIRPWCTCIEQELNLKLFGRNNREYFVEFNLDGLIRGDFQTRMDGLGKGVQNAIMTPNEARKKMNLPPKEGGDDLVLQQNMTRVGELGKGAVDEKPEPTNLDGEGDDQQE